MAVMTDAHANLPALRAALTAIRAEGCDRIYHTGDAIGIGPYPAECLDLLLDTPGARLVMGNHDAWFAFGLPTPRPPWMSEGELRHQLWTHAQLDPALRPVVAGWPYARDEHIEGGHVRFLHYALDETGRGFRWLGPDPRPEELDVVFGEEAHLYCFGHDHAPRDVQGRARYLNPGALGCSVEPVARFAIVGIEAGRITTGLHSVPYDDAELIREFARREVPERAFILRTFFGRASPWLSGG
ncbi:MAG TPA: metallophosphoesterase family protein [Thermomicrobiales bacterium]